MAYCRFAPGGVYIYHHINGFLCCCSCRLTKKKRYQISSLAREFHKSQTGKPGPKTFSMHQDFSTKSRREMIKHIQAHKQAGHRVTSDPITRLRQEIKQFGDIVE